MTKVDEVLYELELTRSKSGLTATELAALIYSRRKAYPQLVEAPLRQLLEEGRIEKLPRRAQDGQYTYRIRPPPPIKRRKID